MLHAVVESFAVLTLFRIAYHPNYFWRSCISSIHYFRMSTAHDSSSGPMFMSILDFWNVKDEVSATATEQWASEEAE